MSLPCWFFPLRVRFLRPSRTFPEGLQTHALRQFNQDGSEVCCAHGIKHVPLGLGDRDHHTVVRRGDFVRDRVERHLFIHDLLARVDIRLVDVKTGLAGETVKTE